MRGSRTLIRNCASQKTTQQHLLKTYLITWSKKPNNGNNKNLSTQNSISSETIFQNKGEEQAFSDIWKLREFITYVAGQHQKKCYGKSLHQEENGSRWKSSKGMKSIENAINTWVNVAHFNLYKKLFKARITSVLFGL